MTSFKANAHPLLVGSLPMTDYKAATDMVMAHTPEVPLWVQLPLFKEEGMINQFLPGLPGLTEKGDKFYLDTQKENFDQEFLSFFEDYLSLSEPGTDLEGSRFAFTEQTGKGFTEFIRQVDGSNRHFNALKGQVTGPITFATALKDEQGKDVFYNDQLRDVVVKQLGLNAGWQAQTFAKRGATPIIFLDEPALAGMGTSAYITITREDVIACVEEIVEIIHREKGLVGIHVCANTEWDMLLESGIDIINFDAFSYFDKFILYPEQIKTFVNQGGILAMGIVPTERADLIAAQTLEGLVQMFNDQLSQLTALGIDQQTLIEQIFITPSCGTGSLDLDSAKRVLELTRDLSAAVRTAY
ncbi:MAG: hypothetical protein HUK40_14785 [Desulfobacter sp.]|nr:hypothetical protein [Desulfobacter sp.]WDP87626.1 MAG: hypothetical protein HUN05_22915 [Desulfobacter sp.]